MSAVHPSMQAAYLLAVDPEFRRYAMSQGLVPGNEVEVTEDPTAPYGLRIKRVKKDKEASHA